jgi:hypothetical protein
MHKTILGMRAMCVGFGLSPSSALPKFWCRFYLPTGKRTLLSRKNVPAEMFRFQIK